MHCTFVWQVDQAELNLPRGRVTTATREEEVEENGNRAAAVTPYVSNLFIGPRMFIAVISVAWPCLQGTRYLHLSTTVPGKYYRRSPLSVCMRFPINSAPALV